jgi:hypothetical protein
MRQALSGGAVFSLTMGIVAMQASDHERFSYGDVS